MGVGDTTRLLVERHWSNVATSPFIGPEAVQQSPSDESQETNAERLRASEESETVARTAGSLATAAWSEDTRMAS
jgi:hypothetical protein